MRHGLPLPVAFLCLLVAVCTVRADVGLPIDENLVDLSWPYNERSMHWVDFRNFSMEVAHEGTVNYKGINVWWRAEDIALNVHTGTHMDAPLHFAKDKWSIDEIPIAHFANRPLVVVDVTKKVSINRDYAVTVDDLQNWEQVNGHIPEGAVVFIRTGFGRYYHNRLQYIGTSGNSHADVHTPGLDSAAAEWLVSNRLIVGIGLDALSLDPGQGEGFFSHRVVLERNIFIIENLNTNLNIVPMTGARVNLFPMNIEGASGAPCRVIVNLNSAFGAAKPSAMVFLVMTALLYFFN